MKRKQQTYTPADHHWVHRRRWPPDISWRCIPGQTVCYPWARRAVARPPVWTAPTLAPGPPRITTHLQTSYGLPRAQRWGVSFFHSRLAQRCPPVNPAEKKIVGLNIFYAGREYTETDWERLKVRHYPLHDYPKDCWQEISTHMRKSWFKCILFK